MVDLSRFQHSSRMITVCSLYVCFIQVLLMKGSSRCSPVVERWRSSRKVLRTIPVPVHRDWSFSSDFPQLHQSNAHKVGPDQLLPNILSPTLSMLKCYKSNSVLRKGPDNLSVKWHFWTLHTATAAPENKWTRMFFIAVLTVVHMILHSATYKLLNSHVKTYWYLLILV